MTKWSGVIANPGGGAVDGLNALVWNVEVEGAHGGQWAYLPGSNNGPDGLPPGYTGMIAAWVDQGGFGIQIRANCNFVAPFHMILTKVKFVGRFDITMSLAYGVDLQIEVNGVAKKIRARPLLNTEVSLTDIIGMGTWRENEFIFRPLIIPKGKSVRVRFRLTAGSNFGPMWVRFGNCQLGYRAPWNIDQPNFNFGGRTKSWLSTRRELLPGDSMHLAIKGTDIDGEDVKGVYVNGFRSGSSIGPVLLASETGFAPFPVSGIPVTEILTFTNPDGDGDGSGDSPEANLLGLGQKYDEPDQFDPQTFTTAAANFFTFNVAKRTPLIRFNSSLLPSKLTGIPNMLVNFPGYVEDPDQSALKDFLPAITVQLMRNNVGLETGSVQADGVYNIPRTLNQADLGALRAWRISSPNTNQYNQSTSVIHRQTVWQIIRTKIAAFTAHLPPFHIGELLDLLAELRDSDTDETLPGLSVKILANDTVEGTGFTDINGQYSINKELLTPTLLLKAKFDGAITDYQEYQISESPTSNINAERYEIATRILLGLRPDLVGRNIYKDDLFEMLATLTTENYVPLTSKGLTFFGGPIPTQEQMNAFREYGDFNSNGIIDMNDVNTLTAHYPSSVGMPQYDTLYDLNKDGDINILDLTAMSARFETTIATFFQNGISKKVTTDQNGMALSGGISADVIGVNRFNAHFIGSEDKTRSQLPYYIYYLPSNSAADVTILDRIAQGIGFNLRVLLNNLPISDTDPKLTVTFTIKDHVTQQVVKTTNTQGAYVEITPASYPVSYDVFCNAKYQEMPYVFSPKTVTFQAAGETQTVNFNIELLTTEGEGEGRIHITLNVPPSAVAGETVTISGSTSYLLRLAGNRPIRVPFCSVKIFVNDKETMAARSNFKGEFTVDWKAPSAGSYEIYASVVRAFRGQVAKSSTETITVIA